MNKCREIGKWQREVTILTREERGHDQYIPEGGVGAGNGVWSELEV